jgi:hypothetical protein
LQYGVVFHCLITEVLKLVQRSEIDTADSSFMKYSTDCSQPPIICHLNNLFVCCLESTVYTLFNSSAPVTN